SSSTITSLSRSNSILIVVIKVLVIASPDHVSPLQVQVGRCVAAAHGVSEFNPFVIVLCIRNECGYGEPFKEALHESRSLHDCRDSRRCVRGGRTHRCLVCE